MSTLPSTKPRIVVLISGGGSNLQAIIDACKNNTGSQTAITATLAAVISNRPDAYGLQRARMAGISDIALDHKSYSSREQFDAKLAETIDQYQPDIVVLAGFMRILSESFVKKYQGRLLNVHPSLLPKYPGLNTHQRALDAGDTEAGVTVHFVTPELDGGPPIVQAKINIETDDTADSLAQRVLVKEHKIYPLAVQWLANGRLSLTNGKAMLDNKPLPSNGLVYSD